ncbi:MAG TPA: histidinol-phosphate transaminase [Candidatus Latescibacteria bacterium]|jgi:histidinol-phosphate aminotransferase|nr:histidinol-phosphate transaminase [Candidatus Latescibacterota bacterium]HJP34169.1 histidinol-phosphate transaminase [Candidatus Latescibacterota bacterium]
MADTSAFLPHIASMAGYLPGEQPRDSHVIKLNTNENPYAPSPLVLARLRAAVDNGLRRYPDAGANGIRQRLAALFAFPAEQFVIGNGSDELLNVALRCFAGPGDTVAYATPSYPYYAKLIDLQAAQAVPVEFGDDYRLPPALSGTNAAVTFVPNPNSPTGTAVSSTDLDDLAADLDGILVIDEAYVDFCQEGALDLVRRRDNVIVMRTLSKSFSLAGMRIGYCVAAPEVAAGLWKVKEHYNVNSLSQIAAEAALDDIGWMQSNAERIIATRGRLTTRMRDLGFHVWDSAANFILCRVPTGADACRLHANLRDQGILVRYFPDNPRLADCLRISIGTDDDMDLLLKVLKRLV